MILFFSHRNEFYYLTYELLMKFWNRSLEGGRKSFRYDELEKEFFLHSKGGVLVPYLEGMQKDLDVRG